MTLTLAEVAACALLAGAVLLLAAAPGHVRALAATTAAIRRHGVVPASWAGPIACVLGPVEGLLGTGTIAAYGVAPSSAGVGAVVASLFGVADVLLYTAFAVYLCGALRRAPGTPCACFAGPEPVSGVGVARAVLLAVAPIPALVSPPSLGDTPSRLALLAAAVLVAAVAWAIPAVLAVGGAPSVRSPNPVRPAAHGDDAPPTSSMTRQRP